MERNLKYWFLYIGKTSLQVFGMIVGIVAVCAFFDGGNFFDRFISQLPMYLGMMCMMVVVVVYGFTNITTIFPMTVSLGARRSSSIIAMMIVNHVIFTILLAIAVASLIYSTPGLGEFVGVAWPLFIGVAALLMFLGNLVGVFSNRFGRTAGMIFYIVFVILMSVGAGLATAFLGKTDFVKAAITSATGLFFLIAVVGVLLDIFSVWLTIKSVAKKDISF